MDKDWDSSTKIIVGIDIGTTYSAASFAYLIDGHLPKVVRVTKWPGQRRDAERANIPSWIWYDAEGKPVKLGAEAADEEIDDAASENGWKLVKHFKLHLHPKDMRPPGGFILSALPDRLNADDVYCHLLHYMFDHVKSFFYKETFNGQEVWDKHADSMEVVITHPNGWGIHEQQRLRVAAIKAKLTSPERADAQIKFVSEAEASIHFCIHSLKLSSSVIDDDKLIVCDAGGSTVDTTVYKVNSAQPELRLEEIKASACVQAGSIFVDEAATKHLRSKLEHAGLSKSEVDGYVKTATEEFGEMVKPEYDGVKTTMGFKIGEKSFNKSNISITNGRMRLPGETIKSFFDPCVNKILESVKSQVKNVKNPYVFLVGGFGDNLYLQNRLKDLLGDSGKFTTNNQPGAKAVADGAVIWAISRRVISRAARYSYGVPVAVPFDPSKRSHTKRKPGLSPLGFMLSGGWSEIISKDTVMSTDSIVGVSYCRPFMVPKPELANFSAELYSTKLPGNTEFMKDKDGAVLPDFHQVCTITADMRELSGHLNMSFNPIVGVFWEMSFKVCIQFGDTELKAYIEWEDEEGNIHKGKASTIAASVV